MTYGKTPWKQKCNAYYGNTLQKVKWQCGAAAKFSLAFCLGAGNN